MTYIIAGKLEDSTFLMADSIATFKQDYKNSYTLTDKITKLESSIEETYYSLAGGGVISSIIYAYDRWLSKIRNESNDFITGEKSINHIERILNNITITNIIPKEESNASLTRLFFLDKNNVVYYNLDDLRPVKDGIDVENIGTNLKLKFIKKTLETGYYIKSSRPGSNRIPINYVNKIEEYCKDYFKGVNNGCPDFKDRFSFVELFNDKVSSIRLPYKKFSDIIAEFAVIDFEKIDTDDDFESDINSIF